MSELTEQELIDAVKEHEELKNKAEKLAEALDACLNCGDCCPIHHCTACDKRAEQVLKEYRGEE